MAKPVIFETYLPVFRGFYNTIFEPDFDQILIDNNVQFEDIQFDNTAYENKVAKLLCEYLAKRFGEEGLVHSIEFEGVYSPKYYNYSNDSINCKIHLSKSNLKELKRLMKEQRTKPRCLKN